MMSNYIKPAEIFALAGESGCGKTTAARMILGFEEPTSGAITYQGQRDRTSKNKKVWFKGVQAIFQDPFGTFNPLHRVDRYFFETVRNYKLVRSNFARPGSLTLAARTSVSNPGPERGFGNPLEQFSIY